MFKFLNPNPNYLFPQERPHPLFLNHFMQIADMKAVRSFYAHKHLFSRLNQSRIPDSLHPQFSSHFRSSALRLLSDESALAALHEPIPGNVETAGTPGRVWSMYDPVSGKMMNERRARKEEGIDCSAEVKEENLSDEGDTQMEISSSEGKARMGLPSYSGGSEEFGDGKRLNMVSGLVFEDKVGSKKKGKGRISWVCEACGYTDGQWWGYCRGCGKVGSLKQFSEGKAGSGGKVTGMEVSENVVRSWLPQKAGDMNPSRLTDVKKGMNQLHWKIPLAGQFGGEISRVLGGGLVPGSLILVGGDPGVGKSTMLLQIAAILADGQGLNEPAPVLYVSGEESVEQIGNRADRLGIETEDLFLYSSTNIEDILEKVQVLSPRALIIDSIQTVYLKGVTGSAGGLTQVNECTSALVRFAKKTSIPVFLIGHVTKSGDIAGPRVLEHMVDVVLYMEGEKCSSYRLLRPVKNRFGSADELGVFEMSQLGLRAVSNPSEIYLSEQQSDSEFLVGLAVAVIMDGSRSFLIEIQALCVSGSLVSSHVNGIPASRAGMIISVLKKQAGLMLQQNDIILNVVSGLMLKETAGDLAIAAAICSSFLEFPIPSKVAFIGEIGLGGELRMVPRMENRVNTVAKLGYSMCVVPKSAEKSLASLGFEGMKIVGCKNLKDVINRVFTTQEK